MKHYKRQIKDPIFVLAIENTKRLSCDSAYVLCYRLH